MRETRKGRKGRAPNSKLVVIPFGVRTDGQMGLSDECIIAAGPPRSCALRLGVLLRKGGIITKLGGALTDRFGGYTYTQYGL